MKNKAKNRAPVKDYNQKDKREIIEEMSKMSNEEVRKTEQFEEEHKNRDTVKNAAASRLQQPQRE